MARKTMKLAALALICTGGSGLANATEVFRLEGFGAVSRAMGGVATASDVGPAGMMTNPATLSLMAEGNHAMGGLDLVTTDIEVRDEATGETVSSHTHSRNRGPYVAPEAAFVHRAGPLAIGVGAFAQGGLGTEYGDRSFLSRANGGLDTGLANSSRLLVLNIPLAASFQVNERLAIGAGIDAMWQGLNLDLLLGGDQVGALAGGGRLSGSGPVYGALGAMLGGGNLRGAHFSLTRNQPLASGIDARGYTGRIGMVYQASADTRLGAAFTAKSQMNDMEGHATLTAVDSLAGEIPLQGKIKIRDFQMPATLNLGISHRVNDALTLAADVSRVYWKDVMKDIKVAFEADIGGNVNILLPQNYRDQNVLALGAAYQVNEQLTLRAGLRIADQALRSSTLFAVIPATPKRHISAGIGYRLSPNSKLDFAYSHAFKETMNNSSLPNTSDPIEVKHAQDNASISYTYSF